MFARLITRAPSQTRYFSTAASTTAIPSLQTQKYVHPLSQIALSHLQITHPTFLAVHRLADSLKIEKNGSFVIQSAEPLSPDSSSIPPESSTPPLLKIWTSYDKESRRHYLNVQTLVVSDKTLKEGSFMLQDNASQPWHDSSKMSTDERVRSAVDTLVDEINGGGN